MKSLLTLIVVLFVGVPSAALGQAVADPPVPFHVQRFHLVVRDYALLHKQVERTLPPPRLADDADNLFVSWEAMATAMIRARPNAREVDFFEPEISDHIRQLIKDALARGGYRPGDLLASNIEEADPACALPAVNQRFPWGRGALMWPGILEQLPGVPAELEYRFVGRDLVLLDVHADLVVDILRNAIR